MAQLLNKVEKGTFLREKDRRTYLDGRLLQVMRVDGIDLGGFRAKMLVLSAPTSREFWVLLARLETPYLFDVVTRTPALYAEWANQAAGKARMVRR